jgi:hypothetical protein
MRQLTYLGSGRGHAHDPASGEGLPILSLTLEAEMAYLSVSSRDPPTFHQATNQKSINKQLSSHGFPQ